MAMAAVVLVMAFVANYPVLFGILIVAIIFVALFVRERRRNAELHTDNRALERDLDRARGRRS